MINYKRYEGLLYVLAGVVTCTTLGFSIGHRVGMHDVHKGQYECVRALDEIICKEVKL